jgi:hypothetical protein
VLQFWRPAIFILKVMVPIFSNLIKMFIQSVFFPDLLTFQALFNREVLLSKI